MDCIQALAELPTAQTIEAFYEKVKSFRPWNANPYNWPVQFLLDSELNWMDGKTTVDDL
jgi:hypothetical protein